MAVRYLLKHYLFPKEGGLVAFALWIAVGGVVLGVVQLMVVLSVMSGMQDFLQQCYTRISSDMVVVPREDNPDREVMEALLAKQKGVVAVSHFGFGQALILKDRVGGVTLEGIDKDGSKGVTPWEQIWVEPPSTDLEKNNPHWIWLGAQLAKKLNVKQGDEVQVFIPGQSKKVVPFVVTAITKFGIYDHDMRYARIDFAALRELFAPTVIPRFYKVKAETGTVLDALAARLYQAFSGKVTVKLWSDINQNFFKAVAHQKLLLFFILQIVTCLAAMNVVNLLLMSSYQRRKDIAILRAMGMRFWGVFQFFVLQGCAIGGAGIVLGIGFGILACRLFEKLQPAILSESIYNVTRLPVTIRPVDVAGVAIGAFVLCVIFSAVPAFRAARMRPAVALRQD